jgi:hypothetical protein
LDSMIADAKAKREANDFVRDRQEKRRRAGTG